MTLHARHPTGALPVRPVAPSLADRRILVVEDEFLLALDMEVHLEAAGAEVVGPVPSLTDAALLLAIAPRLDGAVLDVNLGGEMVYPLADALMGAGVPVAFVTGYAQADLPERFHHVPRFEKPVAVDRLAWALGQALAPTREPSPPTSIPPCPLG